MRRAFKAALVLALAIGLSSSAIGFRRVYRARNDTGTNGLIDRFINIIQSNGATTDPQFIGDIDDAIFVEDANNLSAVYDFQFSADGVNWASPIRGTTVNDTELAFWRLEQQQANPTAGTVEIKIPRAKYMRMHTVTYTGGAFVARIEGIPSPGFVSHTIVVPATIGVSAAQDISDIDDLTIQEFFNNTTATIGLEISLDNVNWFEAVRETGTNTVGTYMYQIRGRDIAWSAGHTTVEVSRARWVRMRCVSATCTGTPTYTFFGNLGSFATDVTLTAPTSVTTAQVDVSSLEDIEIQDVFTNWTGHAKLQCSENGTDWTDVLDISGGPFNGDDYYKLLNTAYYAPTFGKAVERVTRIKKCRSNVLSYTAGSLVYQITGRPRSDAISDTGATSVPATIGVSSNIDVSALEGLAIQEHISGATGTVAIEASLESTATNFAEVFRETFAATTQDKIFEIDGKTLNGDTSAIGSTNIATIQLSRARWVRLRCVSATCTGTETYNFLGRASPGLVEVVINAPTSNTSTTATSLAALEDIEVQDCFTAYQGDAHVELSADTSTWSTYWGIDATGAPVTGCDIYKMAGFVLGPTVGQGVISHPRALYGRMRSSGYVAGTASFRFLGRVRTSGYHNVGNRP